MEYPDHLADGALPPAQLSRARAIYILSLVALRTVPKGNVTGLSRHIGCGSSTLHAGIHYRRFSKSLWAALRTVLSQDEMEALGREVELPDE